MKTLFTLFLLCSIAWAHTVTLTWQLAPEYTRRQNIYRQVNCTGNFVKRAQVTSTTVEWVDNYVTNGKTYCYYVTATDINNVSSPPSNTATAVIPSE